MQAIRTRQENGIEITESVDLHPLDRTGILDKRTHVFLMVMRQALIIALGAVEEYLGIERSITPRHKR